MPTKDHLIRIDFAHFNPHRNERVEGFVFDRRHDDIKKIEIKAWFSNDERDTRTLKCGKITDAGKVEFDKNLDEFVFLADKEDNFILSVTAFDKDN